MRTTYVFFAVGLIYGFGLGVLLDESNMINLTSISLMAGLLIFIPALWMIESRTHHRRLAAWSRIRERGKYFFILTWYVVLRGGIFSAILMIALRGSSVSWPVHEIAIPIVCVALFVIGHNEWTDCEHEFRIRSVPHSAQRIEPAATEDSSESFS